MELLSFWLGNIVDLLEPDVMIVGGGVASTLKPFLPEIKDRLRECCVNQSCQEIPLVSARYGEDAGIAGSAALCFAAASSRNGTASSFRFPSRNKPMRICAAKRKTW